jgi:hypothetical protein
MNSLEILDLLGHKAVDRVTKFKGTIASICFDLYGCVQAALTPEVNDKGEENHSKFFDISRLDVDRTSDRVMYPPETYFNGLASAIDRGPAERPTNAKNL